jgi:hypothetical protein
VPVFTTQVSPGMLLDGRVLSKLTTFVQEYGQHPCLAIHPQAQGDRAIITIPQMPQFYAVLTSADVY